MVLGMPSASEYILDEYEEELKYVLQNPDVQRRFGTRNEMFIQRSAALTKEIVAICLDVSADRAARPTY
eukprot:2342957-Pyramimonas_sp.AAC.1